MTERSALALFETAKPHLEAALSKSPQGLTLEDVRRAITAGQAQLWMGDDSAGVTEVTKDCNVWLLGGQMKDVEPLLAEVEAKAKAAGLDTITIYEARKGWERVLAPFGYRRRSVLFKEL